MKKYFFLAAAGLFVLGFGLGFQFANLFTRWFTALDPTYFRYDGLGDPIRHTLRVAVYGGVLLSVGPLCVLIARRPSRHAFWAFIFGLLAVCVSFGVALFCQTQIARQASEVQRLTGNIRTGMSVADIPVAPIFLTGTVSALVLALIKRTHIRRSAPPAPGDV